MSTKFRALPVCKSYLLRLALCAFLGAVFGVFFVFLAGDSLFLLLRCAACCPASVVNLLLAVFLPFALSILLILCYHPWLIYPICLLRFFAFSACAFCILRNFGSAGGLMLFLLQFQEFVLLPCIAWLSIRRLCGLIRIRDCIYVACAALALVLIQCLLVSPFLVRLIDTYETMGRYAVHVGFHWRL